MVNNSTKFQQNELHHLSPQIIVHKITLEMYKYLHLHEFYISIFDLKFVSLEYCFSLKNEEVFSLPHSNKKKSNLV